MDTGESNEKQDVCFRNVVLATDASDTMDCEEYTIIYFKQAVLSPGEFM